MIRLFIICKLLTIKNLLPSKDLLRYLEIEQYQIKQLRMALESLKEKILFISVTLKLIK